MREKRWDFYKGMLMFSVVVGHTITALKAGASEPVWVLIFIRTFDMPMFAFVTGVFLRKSCNKHLFYENILNKVGTILLPIILWNWILNLLTGNFSLSIGQFWFLWSIFYVCCIVILIDVAKKRRLLQVVLFGIAIVIFHTLIIDRWNIGFILFPCVIGYYYKELTRRITLWHWNTKILRALIIIVFFSCQLFWTTEYNVWNAGCNVMAEGALPKITFRGLVGIMGCFSMKSIFDFIYDRLPKDRSFLLRGGQLGTVTMEVYILQSLLVEKCGAIVVNKIVTWIGFNPFIINVTFLGLVIAPVLAVLSLIVMYYIILLIKKIPFIGKYIYGVSYTDIKREK